MDRTDPLPRREQLRAILRSLLVPLATLALSSGVKFQDLVDILKLAFVDAGKRSLRASGERVNASTLSVMTGLHRKDLANFLAQDEPFIDPEPPLEAKLFARWTTDARFLDADGLPLPLKRGGSQDGEADSPSFDELAHAVTTDVRPRALLESLLRLGLVKQDESGVVALGDTRLVPSAAQERLLDLFRDNLRDHLSAGVANTLGTSPAFLEQSIYANGLTPDSANKFHVALRKRWLTLTQGLVPQIQRSIDEDRVVLKDSQLPSQRIRIGLYFYTEAEQREPKV
jgi:Family of unknown function (DUF6502)